MDDSNPSIPCSTSTSVSTESNESPTIHLKNTQPAFKSDLKQNTSATVSNYKHGIAFSISKILLLILTQFPLRAAGYPVLSLLSRSNIPDTSDFLAAHKEEPMDARTYWINMGISVTLVLLGGVFAGLTLGLMGQDEIYLQVIQQSGEVSEKKAAAKVLSLLKRGKHWVLVTLLLANVITNESLPIVLDRVLGGGWPAVVSSTVAIVIFGEIIPQSISVRYGLSVGAWFAPFVLALMYITYPVAYPVALLLDRILGEDHGTIYKRAGLKTLVGLHKTMGVERLNDDEVTIISAVLDLKDKPVASIMTPMDDVYTMSADRILDEPTIEEILHSGFNRIPIHAPEEPTNFIGMLLVRTLITYDPEDNFPISSFPLATLPETGPQTSCLNILNYFQEGKSHMVVVSNTPGASSGAVGVLTLEDVIEELIGEEIIDESDVYVDIHKAIRRTIPGPLSKANSLALFRHSPRASLGYDEDGIRHRLNPLNKASNPKQTSNASITIKRSNLENFTSPLNPSTTHVPSLMDTHSPTDSHTPNPSHTQQKNGYVPSNLSKSINNPTENDSSTNLDNHVHIHDQLLPVPDGNYGSIHRTEQGAVREALYQNSLSPRRSHSYLTENALNSRDNSASRHSSKSEANNNKYYSNGNNDSKNGYSHPQGYYDSNNGEEFANYQDRIVNVNDIPPEFHSYRTGGIIESIINVDGVSKTIIEDVNKDTIPESYRSQANFGGQGYQENLSTEENGYGTTGGIQSSAASGRSRRSGGEGEHESLLPRH